MKPGDLVKFKRLGTHPRPESDEWRIGILMEYNRWDDIAATVLYQSRLYKVWEENVEKMDKKDVVG